VTQERELAEDRADQGDSGARLGRRRLLTAIGAGGAALGLGGGGYALGYEVGRPAAPEPSLATDAIPFYGGPHRPRQGRAALITVRLRAHLVHQQRPGDAAQPAGLQGRHQQPQGGGHRPARRARPVIPSDSHVRLAGQDGNGGAMLLRRGYSFTDGLDRLGQLDAGLFFICFQRDPRQQFVKIQRVLGSREALNEYMRHTGSALFACPGGIQPGRYVGEPLLG
jgi:hypothetical protein